VTGFAIDHRKVMKGNVFGAFRGAAFNGEDFIPAAVEHGAIAVVARPDAKVENSVHLADERPRKLFSELASKYFAPYPETVVAVTGTNGKTSTVEMTRQIWRMMGHRSASIGTLGVTTSDDQVKTGLTTPDIVTFLNNMAGLKRMGISHVAYEASSHGLDQHRAEGVPLGAAAFTNFSRDHLDYHETMDSYFEAKMRLFDELLPPGKPAVIWTDDPKSGEVMERARRRGHEVLSVGRAGETIRLVEQSPTALGQTLLLEHEGKTHRLALPLIGAYQASNVLTAAGLDVPIAEALPRFLTFYDGRLTRHTRPYEGIPEVLHELRDAGVAIALLTNKPLEQSVRILEAFELAPYFRWMVGGDGPWPRKPAPASLQHIMEQASAAPADTVLIGDSDIDLQTARNAGVRICLARYGFGYDDLNVEDLRGDEAIVDSPAQITDVLHVRR